MCLSINHSPNSPNPLKVEVLEDGKVIGVFPRMYEAKQSICGLTGRSDWDLCNWRNRTVDGFVVSTADVMLKTNVQEGDEYEPMEAFDPNAERRSTPERQVDTERRLKSDEEHDHGVLMATDAQIDSMLHVLHGRALVELSAALPQEQHRAMRNALGKAFSNFEFGATKP